MSTSTFEPRELSVVFLCYDEPKRDEFFIHLNEQVQHAIKVEGIKGIDNAHKAAAEAATTERFILVDGDALVDPAFWDVSARIPTQYQSMGGWSFTAKNIINDTTYGPGGVKVFTREFLRSMKTHENSDSPNTSFEFCWQEGYSHFSSVWSTTYINQSPLQAFRSGFREVTKLLCPKCQYTLFEDLPYYTQRKIVQWITLGADVENGSECIKGARSAAMLLTLNKVDPTIVNDYEALEYLFNEYDHGLDFDKNTFLDKFPICTREQSSYVKEFIRTQRPKPLSIFTPCYETTE
jgi:hypothetical protein